MNTLKNIIEREHQRMLKASIIDASREEALGYLIWRHFRSQRWKLFQVVYWILRYADYHQEAAAIDEAGKRRLTADCAALYWAKRRKQLQTGRRPSAG
jgi:hypothetical protein